MSQLEDDEAEMFGYFGPDDRDDRRACLGAPVVDVGDMAECNACGMRVRWDLQEHPFFGFEAACDRKGSE